MVTEYITARTVTAATALEVKETAIFTAASIWSGLPVEATTLIPAMYPAHFSRDEYGFDADTLAKLTRGRS